MRTTTKVVVAVLALVAAFCIGVSVWLFVATMTEAPSAIPLAGRVVAAVATSYATFLLGTIALIGGLLIDTIDSAATRIAAELRRSAQPLPPSPAPAQGWTRVQGEP